MFFAPSEPTKITPVASKIDYDRTSDYAMTHFTMTVMDEKGEPSRVIKGRDMTHFPADNSTHITDPIAEFVNQQKDTWIVTAKQGLTHDKGKIILLTENVVVTSKEDPDTELQTSVLTLNTAQSIAYTEAAVKMVSSYGETNSVGLHATLENKIINLHSRVKGHYDAPPPQ